MPHTFDFTTPYDRRGRDATAIDGIGQKVWGFEPDAAKPGFDEIPLWVADMNFATCPAVTRALANRIAHPLFGYFQPSDAYFDAIRSWQGVRHGWKSLSREAIGYENGVHGGITSALCALSNPGDAVLVHSPVYPGFLSDLRDTGRKVILSPLVRDEGGTWRMDYATMERQIAEEHVRLAILCSPHNPTGRVWGRSELEAAMDLFQTYDVTVISDEIWSDIVFAGHAHTPTCMVSKDAEQRTVAFFAPSKTFNLAGLVGSYHVIPNPELRGRVVRHGRNTHYNEMNVLSMHALIGAYGTEGQAWVDELNAVLEENCRCAATFLQEHMEGCHVTMPEGTYMLFLECGTWLRAHNLTQPELLKRGWDVGVAWQDGKSFAWDDAIRVNVALPMPRLREAMRRIETYVLN